MAQTDKQYWIGRAEDKVKNVDKIEEKYLKRLKGSYRRTNRDVRKDIDSFYNAFAIKNELSYAQATQFVSAAEQRILQQSATEIADKILRKDSAIKKDLEAFAKKRQINRLQGLDSEIRSRIAQLGDIQQVGMNKTLGTTLQEVYARDRWTIDTGQGFGVQFGRISDSKVNVILNQPWVGNENYSSKIWENKERLANIIQQELTEGIIAGNSSADIASIVSQKMGSEFSAADRLVRTEMTHVAAVADIESYKDSGIDWYEYVATLDDRTSAVCGTLDNQHFRREQAQAGVNLPPMHPNCRSTTIPWFGADFKTGLERRAKDAEGKSILVPANMSFAEYEKKFIVEDKRKVNPVTNKPPKL